MKKLLGLLILTVLTGLLTMTAFADVFCNPSEAYAGNKVLVDGFVDEDGNYCPDLGRSYMSDYYRVSGSLSETYVSKYGIDANGDVYIIINPSLTGTREKELTGTITLREIGGNKGIYKAKLESGDLTVNPGGKDNVSDIESRGSGVYALPYDYQTNKVGFGSKQGTLRFDFDNYAYFSARFAGQGDLFLGYHTTTNTGLTSKYPNATLSFIAWTTKPKFDVGGTLGIYVNSDEYVYEIASDGTLKNPGGKYNASTGAYEISTNTLGSYVISSQKLTAASGAASSASSTPAASSSAASSPASPAASSPASSAASPASSASSQPETSSSQPEESSSQPEPSSQPEAPSSSQPTDVPAEAEKGGLPLVPILIGVLAVLAAALLFIFLGGKKNRKPKFEDWDE